MKTRRSPLIPFLLPLLVLISACSPFVTNTPPPSPQRVHIAYTSTLRPFVERLHHCALENPEIALITEETSISSLESTGADLTLWSGEPIHGISGYAISLGMDQIVVTAGSKVALQNVSTEQLWDLYTGSNSTYQVWTYSEGSELRDIFENAVLGESPTSSDVLLVPNPAAMIDAITADPMAIGYLPQSWLTGELQRITIEADLVVALTHPILALTHSEPAGNLQQYLVCLQNASP